MAASSKDVKLASSFCQRLQDLGCPYTDQVDESFIVELLFTPGESRIRILQWIFSKLDSKLNELLDPQFAVMTDSKMDSRIQRLLFISSMMGLCTPDDADLVRGCTSAPKQVAFFDQLLDLVCIVDEAEDPRNKDMFSPGTVSGTDHLDDQFSRDCLYIDNLADGYKMERLMTTEAKLLPPDIMRLVEKNWEGKAQKDTDSPPVPDLNILAETARTLGKDLERQTEILEELKKKYPYPEHDAQWVSRVNTTLKLVLSELSQLMVSFSHCFDSEMKPWCNKEPPKPTQLGLAFKRVHTLLQQFAVLLQSLGGIRSSYTHLTTELREQIHQVTSKEDQRQKLDESTLSALNGIRSSVEVLQESMLNTTTTTLADSTMNSTVSAPVVKLD